MDFSKDFFIVATYPFNFSWTYSNQITNMELYHFKYKNGYIMSINEILYLNIVNDNVNFVGNKSMASKIEIESTKIKTNFRIKYQNKYIRHKKSFLFCDTDEKTDLYLNDSTWIFIENKINPAHTFVIARYNEDVNWTRYLPGKVIIYNKGKDNLDLKNTRDNIEIKKVENVGREGHTYLYHIVENYDKLTERVTFLQGDPFFHSPDLLELCCMEKDYDEVQSLSLWYKNSIKESLPSNFLVKKYCKFLNGARYALYLMNECGHFSDWIDPFWSSKVRRDENPILNFYNRTQLIRKYSKNFYMAIAALFSVKKENILQFKKEEIEKMIEELLRYSSQGGFEGYILERIWYNLFSL